MAVKDFEIVKKIKGQVSEKSKRYLQKVIYPIRDKIMPELDQLCQEIQDYYKVQRDYSCYNETYEIARDIMKYCFVRGKLVDTKEYTVEYGQGGMYERTEYKYYYDYTSRDGKFVLNHIDPYSENEYYEELYRGIVNGKIDVVECYNNYKKVLLDRLQNATNSVISAENNLDKVRNAFFKSKKNLERAEREAESARNEYKAAQEALEEYEKVDIQAMIDRYKAVHEKIVDRQNTLNSLQSKIEDTITRLEEREFGKSGVKCEINREKYSERMHVTLGVPAEIIEKIIVSSVSNEDREEVIRNANLYSAITKEGYNPNNDTNGVGFRILEYSYGSKTAQKTFGDFIKDVEVFRYIAGMCYALSNSEQPVVEDDEIFGDGE